MIEIKVEGDRVVFSGGPFGSHSLDVGSSSPARVYAHWRVYCENAGVRVGSYRLDGEPIGLFEFFRVNESLDMQDVCDILSLPPGSDLAIGGGAAPAFKVERADQRS